MKRLFVLLMAALMTVSLTGLSFAQAKPAEPAKPAKPAEPAKPAAPAEKPAKPKAKSATGEVVSADPAKNILVVKAKEKELTFAVGAKAAKTLAKLKAGDKVTVRYTEAEGKLTAQSIAMAVAKKPEAKKEKPAEKK